MRSLLLFTVITVCFLLSCKKDKPVTSSGLFGKWEISRRYGGNILPADTTYKPGNGNDLQFNRDSTYVQYTKGQATATGFYHIRKNTGTVVIQGFGNTLTFDSDTSFVSFINISGNVLTIKPLLGDIATTQYQKIQN